MKDNKYLDVMITDKGKLIVEPTDSDLWLNRRYYSNTHGGCQGIYCKKDNLEKAKKKLINTLLQNARKELVKAQRRVDQLEGLLGELVL